MWGINYYFGERASACAINLIQTYQWLIINIRPVVGTALGLLFVLVALCTVHLRSPSAQLRHLALLIDQSEDLIRPAMAQCPRDYFGLTEELGRLLQ
jgi:hypothetical protein